MVWQKLSSVEKYRNRYMTVTEDRLLTEYGDEVIYGIVHKAPAILIIPFDGTHFTLIGQYRVVVDHYSWEFPAGHFEHDSIEAAARAELEEEAGLKAGKIISIGSFFVAPGHNTQICHCLLASDLSPGERQLEPSEKGMAVKQVTSAELDTMIAQGEIQDGLTISAYKIFTLWQTQK